MYKYVKNKNKIKIGEIMSKVNYCTPEGYKALLNLQSKIKEQRAELIETMGEATKEVEKTLVKIQSI